MEWNGWFLHCCAESIALQALCNAVANLSVPPSVRPSVRLSVTLRYCVKTRELDECGLHRRISNVSFLRPERLMGDNPIQVKFQCKEVGPLQKQLSCTHLPYNSGTVTDSEESSIKVNRKSTMGFPTSHQPRSCVIPNVAKMGFKYPNWWLFAEISTKTIKSLLQSFIVQKLPAVKQL